MADEIIRELWQIKDDIASKHNYDLKKLVKYLQEKERSKQDEIIDLRSRNKAVEPAEPNAPCAQQARIVGNLTKGR